MYMYMFIYVCVYTHAHTHTHARTHTHTHTRASVVRCVSPLSGRQYIHLHTHMSAAAHPALPVSPSSLPPALPAPPFPFSLSVQEF